jgi:hypothetical protein
MFFQSISKHLPDYALSHPKDTDIHNFACLQYNKFLTTGNMRSAKYAWMLVPAR